MGSSSAALGRCSVSGGRVVPSWFTERDHPRLRDLIEQYRAFAGEPRRRLDQHLAACRAELRAWSGRALAVELIDRAFRGEVVGAVPPARARSAVFRAAAEREAREQVLARAAASLGLAPADLEGALFADLPGERRLREPAEPIDASTLALQANLAIAQAALSCSSEIGVELEGNARAVVRHARLRRLICSARTGRPGGPMLLEVSGPLALFRRTSLYGRHLAELVPILLWCRRFLLRARCVVRGREGVLALDPSAPLPPSKPPPMYDSGLEQRFARDFVRLGSAWELVREPEPVAAEGTLVFPDFALQHRAEPGRRWLLEIAGFWTADYLEEKLRRLDAAGLGRLILCIDAALDCGRRPLPAGASVLPFRKRIDARLVLRTLEGRTGSTGSQGCLTAHGNL